MEFFNTIGQTQSFEQSINRGECGGVVKAVIKKWLQEKILQ
jgi:hypothetical protein